MTDNAKVSIDPEQLRTDINAVFDEHGIELSQIAEVWTKREKSFERTFTIRGFVSEARQQQLPLGNAKTPGVRKGKLHVESDEPADD
ncbi:MAG: hypothetical protein M3O87_06365 [Candidatus Dormibacteraeota bacterium]|nr:hypothetical protein [Candidatus Dormibacteraeota bacterium]